MAYKTAKTAARKNGDRSMVRFLLRAWKKAAASNAYPAICPPFLAKASHNPKSGNSDLGVDDARKIMDITRIAGPQRQIQFFIVRNSLAPAKNCRFNYKRKLT